MDREEEVSQKELRDGVSVPAVSCEDGARGDAPGVESEVTSPTGLQRYSGFVEYDVPHEPCNGACGYADIEEVDDGELVRWEDAHAVITRLELENARYRRALMVIECRHPRPRHANHPEDCPLMETCDGCIAHQALTPP